MSGAWRGALALLGSAALPWALGSEFYVNVTNQVLIYAVLALSLVPRV